MPRRKTETSRAPSRRVGSIIVDDNVPVPSLIHRAHHSTIMLIHGGPEAHNRHIARR